MKRVLLVTAILALMCATAALGRQWTSRSGGFTVEAELVDVKDGNAILRKPDGSELSIPLGKLSLGDIRYIDEILSAAEARVTGKAGAGPEAKSPGSTTTETPPKPPVDQAAGKLSYAWKEGQDYVYRVNLTTERSDFTTALSGDITYKVRAATDEGFQLGVTGELKRSEQYQPVRIVVHPRFRYRRFNDTTVPKNLSVTVDSRGRVVRMEGNSQLPCLLGDLSQLVLEQLPPEPANSWSNAGDTGVSVIVTLDPFYRFYPFSHAEYHEGTDATERTTYTVEASNEKLITVAKQYQLSTTSLVGGSPRIEASGSGKWRFDAERGVPSSLDFEMRVTVREKNKTEEIPVRLHYHLLTQEEQARLAKEAKEAEEARKEKERPLNAKEIADALEDLKSQDIQRSMEAAKRLAERVPMEPNAELAKALEAVLLNHENGHIRGEAAKALKRCSVPESVPTLLKIVEDENAAARSNAIEALVKYKPESAIAAVSRWLPDPFTRGASSKFLKAVGPAAEDAVLVHFENHDARIRAEVCEILSVIGTKKSIPAMEKAIKDESWMVQRPARKALDAINLRQQLPPADK